MKKTQASMQAKIDKLNGNLAEGLDVHIDRTVKKIVNAFHMQEKSTVKKAAMERLRQWAAGKNTTLPLVPDNSSSIVDPAQIIAEENKVDDKKEEKKENVERRCRRDEQAGLKMIQKANHKLLFFL